MPDEMTDDWSGCYGESWSGLIVPEAFCHPAKYSRALIQRIYQHVMAEGWAQPGDVVVDPFGGVALGALDAQRLGLSWVGVELEPRFVALAQQNFDLWQRRYSSLPHWGTARILQGDSRNLAAIVAGAGIGVSSPPFLETGVGGSNNLVNLNRQAVSKNRPANLSQEARGLTYADNTPGQLGAMPAGEAPRLPLAPSVSVASPPYAGKAQEERCSERDRRRLEKLRPDLVGRFDTCFRVGEEYGTDPANLGNLPSGTLSISSPPFGEGETRDRSPVQAGTVADCIARAYTQDRQGTTLGNLASLSCSSPPYEASRTDCDFQRQAASGIDLSMPEASKGYGDSGIGRERTQEAIDTFWSAARTIVEQLHIVLRPGAHAVWVVKAFVRKGQIVDFPGQWQVLCESCGFVTLHEHHALLTEERGTQYDLNGKAHTKKVERISFFRRLAQSKGSPRIDWEIVLCMERR